VNIGSEDFYNYGWEEEYLQAMYIFGGT